jgi:YD repeat-containing protein
VATSAYSYDGIGRLTGLTHTPTGGSNIGYSWTYDAASRITGMTTPDGTTNSIGYDATDQLTGVDYSYQTDETYTYDANGNRETANGNTYTPGAGNRLLSDGTYRYLYNGEGNRKAKYQGAASSNNQVPSGATDITEYLWDHRNRLTAVNHYATYSDYTAGHYDNTSIQYTYDAFDRRIRRITDSNGYLSGGVDYFYNVYQGDNAALEIHDIDGLAIRPRPKQCRKWAESVGFHLLEPGIIEPLRRTTNPEHVEIVKKGMEAIRK